MARHAFESVSARLRDMQTRAEAGEDRTAMDASTCAVAAAVVDRHGEFLVRLKAAVGPELVHAMIIEAAADPETNGWREYEKLVAEALGSAQGKEDEKAA